MKLKTLLVALTASVTSYSAVAETGYGELITNTATLNYTVNNGDVVSAPNATVEFNVDRLIKFNLTALSNTETAPIGEDTAVGFTLTNYSNTDLVYSLPAVTNVTFYNDLNANGVLDTAEQIDSNKITTNITLLQDDGTPDFKDHIKSFIAVYRPLQGVDGTTNDVIITATAIENDATQGIVGSTIVPTPANAPWEETTIQTVAATDADGNFITSQAETITFTFEGANISLDKSVIVVSDPITRGESGAMPTGYVAKAIPGAIIKYTITVTNSGSKDATLTLGDTMPSVFSIGDIIANSYKQAINGAAEAPLTGVSEVENAGIVTISFPSVVASAKSGSTNGSVVTTFEVKLP